MTKQNKTAIIVSLIAVTFFGGALVYSSLASPEPADATERKNITVRDDSRRLGTAVDRDQGAPEEAAP